MVVVATVVAVYPITNEEPRFRVVLRAGRGQTVEDRCDGFVIVTGKVPWTITHAATVADELNISGTCGPWTWELPEKTGEGALA